MWNLLGSKEGRLFREEDKEKCVISWEHNGEG